ncbi:MAG: aminotransferase class I and II [Frankiales bacterium]|nr:aminotransferase class I and II [Frankiales bacterium]
MSTTVALRTVTATRYVLPLREGGSLPGLMEADDLGTWVVKFTGAGQGRKVLVAEVVVGELARALGLPVPELVLVEVDPVLGRAEPDEEVQDLLRASPGLNLGTDFLPGSLGFDPMAHPVAAGLASRVLWLDALVGNVDRSWRNPNLLLWHQALWLIDHGASLVFHHDWAKAAAAAQKPYQAEDHALSSFATERVSAAQALAPLVTRELLVQVTALVPDVWLEGEPGFDGPDQVRTAYVEHLLRRVAARAVWQP